ncbi:MAG: hypothetical protein DME26_11090 [Verrucomicrobia bacterium]|nr:MAG: hypothetical protein DME26_11090 [Verrucomicrobiota bacterium]
MERTENKMETWPERCQERLQPIVERSRQAAVVTDEYVHGHPWTAAGIAAALGMLVGILLCQRHH